MALVYNWSVCAGDVSVALLHAAAISYNLVMRPPRGFYNEESRRTMRRLNKAMYGLRSSPKQRQDHIAHILQSHLNLRDAQQKAMFQVKRLPSLPIHRSAKHDNTLNSTTQKEVVLGHAGDLNVASTIHVLGRNISQKGSYIDIGLNNTCVDITLRSQE